MFLSCCCSSDPISLETRVPELFEGPNFGENPFSDYRIPNEKRKWEDLQACLKTRKIAAGIFASVGTERSFFFILLAGKKCKGMIVRDLNANVKGYILFNVMLLRLCSFREYWNYMNGLKNYDTLPLYLVRELEEKLRADETIPERVKDYYLKNLPALANCYYTGISDWKLDLNDFAPVAYWRKEPLYKHLQALAKAGNIVATVGNIGDWDFIQNVTPPLELSLLNVSNCAQYSILNIRIQRALHVVWTVLDTNSRGKHFSYHLCEHEHSGQPIDKLKEQIQRIASHKDSTTQYLPHHVALKSLLSPTKILFANSKALLNALNELESSTD